MFRRIRKPNYSHEETMALLEQIEAHRHILFGKTTNHQRSELWAFIADTVNSVPNSTGRTVEELKHRWKDLSHKTRNSVRHFSETKSRSDQPFVAPSIYFDMVMRILGDGIFDKSEFNTSCHDGQSLSPRFADDGRNFSSNSEIDVKPDLSTINNFIIADEKSHSLKMHLHSPSTSGIVVGKYLNTSNQNPSSSNEIHPLTSTPSINFSGSTQRKCISELPHQNSGAGENPPHFNEPLPSSSGTGAVSAGKPFLWRPQTQVANLRPMRLDPVTREISEVDGLGLDSDSSEGDSSSSKMTISIAEEGLVAGRVHSQENGEKSASSLPGHQARKRKKLNPSGLPIPSLSVEDLKKLYLVKKIKMIEQKTHCFKTLEQKFKCEINLLQQQAKSGSRPYFHRYSHNPKVARLPKNFNRNEENSQDGTLLQEFDSKHRQSEDEICEQAMAVGGYCNGDDDVDNDGGSTTDGEVVCEQEESGSSGSHDEETPDSHEVKIAT